MSLRCKRSKTKKEHDGFEIHKELEDLEMHKEHNNLDMHEKHKDLEMHKEHEEPSVLNMIEDKAFSQLLAL